MSLLHSLSLDVNEPLQISKSIPGIHIVHAPYVYESGVQDVFQNIIFQNIIVHIEH